MEVRLKGKEPLVVQLSKTAEGHAMEMFGSVEDFEAQLNGNPLNIYEEDGEVRIVCYRLRVAVACVEKPADQAHPEPWLLAKHVRRTCRADSYGAFATEVERPLKVLRAKPKRPPEEPKPKYYCPYCQAEVEHGDRYCTRCGGRLIWLCDRCFAAFDPKLHDRCPWCGRPVRDEAPREGFKERELRRERRFWAMGWPEEKVIGVVYSPNARQIFEGLRREDPEAYARVYDALRQLVAHREETGSAFLALKGGWAYLMGEMDDDVRRWIDGVLKETGIGRFLDEYEVKKLLEFARRRRRIPGA